MSDSPSVPSRAGPVWSPWRSIVAFALVSLAADMVYEGMRSLAGPLLGELGASALTVGVITGAGEAVALVLRLLTGTWADRSQRHWALTVVGYGMTAVGVPLLAVTPFLGTAGLAVAATLILLERTRKAVLHGCLHHHLARQYLADDKALASVNAQARQLEQVSNIYGQVTASKQSLTAMAGQRLSPDRHLEIRLTTTARRLAREGVDRETAVPELREIARGRTDILAEACGMVLGGFLAHPGIRKSPDLHAPALLFEAGAAPDLLGQHAEATWDFGRSGHHTTATTGGPPHDGAWV